MHDADSFFHSPALKHTVHIFHSVVATAFLGTAVSLNDVFKNSDHAFMVE